MKYLKEEFKKVDAYITSLFSLNDDILKEVEHEIRKAEIGWQNVSANQGKFIQMLAQIIRAEQILEIGTFAGYSSIWLARSLDDNGRLTTLELNAEFAKIAQKNFRIAGVEDKINLVIGDALEILPKMVKEDCKFDMIFIDAQNLYYPEYLELAIGLSKKGTLIVADNVIKPAKIFDDSNDEEALAVRNFNLLLGSNEALDSTIVQTVGIKTPDGMSISIVKKD